MALEKGLRAELELESGEKLTIKQLNFSGQNILVKVLPELITHIGLDVAEHFSYIV